MFDKIITPSYLQVIFKGTSWTRSWTLLQKDEEDRHLIKVGCKTIESAVMEVFARHDWRFSNRIAL
jgi:hypothetical protein